MHAIFYIYACVILMCVYIQAAWHLSLYACVLFYVCVYTGRVASLLICIRHIDVCIYRPSGISPWRNSCVCVWQQMCVWVYVRLSIEDLSLEDYKIAVCIKKFIYKYKNYLFYIYKNAVCRGVCVVVAWCV